MKELQDWLCGAIANHPDDSSAPGLLISRLPDGRWYLSFQRFARSFGRGKCIIASARHENFDEAVKLLRDAYTARTYCDKCMQSTENTSHVCKECA